MSDSTLTNQRLSSSNAVDGATDASINASINTDIPAKDKDLPTIGQLMRATSQGVQRLYRTQVGHAPSRVTCHIASDKLMIWAENSVTRIEKLLYQFDREQLERVHQVVDSVCRPQLVEIIEQTLGVKVEALICDTCYEKECTGVVALLSAQPQVRSNRNGSAGTVVKDNADN